MVVDDGQDSKDKAVVEEVDLKSLSDLGIVEVDLEADSYDVPPPPQAGIYLMVFNPAAKPVKVRKEVGRDNYYTYEFELRMQDPKVHPGIVFYNVSPNLGRGQSICTAANLLLKAGYKLKDNKIEMAKLLNAVDKFARGDKNILPVELDWSGYSTKKEKNVFSTMSNFPSDGKGGYKHLCVVDGEEIVGRCKVKRIYPAGSDINKLQAEYNSKKGEDKKGSGSGGSGSKGSGGNGSNKSAVATVDASDFDL